MIKRAQGLKKGSPKNWKTRFFRLTNSELTYYEKDPRNSDAKRKGAIPVSQIIAAEEVMDNSFERRVYLFQVVYQSPPGAVVLYAQAQDPMDRTGWLAALRSLIASAKQSRMYHSSYFDGKLWVCCKSLSQEAEGCQYTTVVE